MRCVRCGKPIGKPAFQTQTKNGAAGWGPKCAQIDGLLERKREYRARLFSASRRPEEETGQLELELEVA